MFNFINIIIINFVIFFITPSPLDFSLSSSSCLVSLSFSTFVSTLFFFFGFFVSFKKILHLPFLFQLQYQNEILIMDLGGLQFFLGKIMLSRSLVFSAYSLLCFTTGISFNLKSLSEGKSLVVSMAFCHRFYDGKWIIIYHQVEAQIQIKH